MGFLEDLVVVVEFGWVVVEFYFVWVSARLLCSEECLPGRFENRRFSQIRWWNSLVVFGVDMSKFGVFSRGLIGSNSVLLISADVNCGKVNQRAAKWIRGLLRQQLQLKTGPYNPTVTAERWIFFSCPNLRF